MTDTGTQCLKDKYPRDSGTTLVGFNWSQILYWIFIIIVVIFVFYYLINWLAGDRDSDTNYNNGRMSTR